jgi:alkanesulfonate monooxygenase SsuD/methylene tetrahydromethanopterin reductase-like flavin-dependent oxidoreductase (luciferase family)
MRIAIQASGGTYAEILEWARFAESRDLDAFAIPDHYLSGPDDAPQPALDALSVMAGLARDTGSIDLVLLVSPVTWRHPAVLAKTAATLADMSDGRVTVGVGTGWWEEEHALFGIPFPERSVRFDMLEEALGYLRAAFSEPPIDFSGEHYSFTAFDMRPRPELRLLVGGTGLQRTPRLAGAYADEFNAYPAPYQGFEEKVERARRAAAAAGRDPAAMALSTTAYLVVAETLDGFHEALERAAAAVGRTPEQVEESLRMRNAPHGTWDRVRATLAGYEERGVSRLYVQTFADDIVQTEEKLAHLL